MDRLLALLDFSFHDSYSYRFRICCRLYSRQHKCTLTTEESLRTIVVRTTGELSIQLVLSGRVLRYSAAFYFPFMVFFLLSLVL